MTAKAPGILSLEMEGVRGLTIVLPLPPPECSPNYAGGLRAKMRAKREAREWAVYATLAVTNNPAQGAPVRWPRVTATAHFTFAVRRTRDDDNMVASLKWYRDGIASVLCGGDDGGWVWAGMPTVAIGPHVGVVIRVTEREE